MSQRFCLTLDLINDPELVREYEHWHQPENIWPEIPQGIKAVGIENMEIWRLGERLFMIIEIADGTDFEAAMEKLAGLPRQQEWESFVAKFQKTSPDATSAMKWQRLERIFQL